MRLWQALGHSTSNELHYVGVRVNLTHSASSYGSRVQGNGHVLS